MDLRITTKYFLEKYFILLGNSMYGNVDSALLWIRLLDKYLVNKCNLKGEMQNPVFYLGNVEKGELELVMSVHVENAFMAGTPETLNNIK